MERFASLVVSAGLAFAGVASASVIDVSVLPEGDGASGRARYGYFSGWENTGFSSASPSNWSGHWYDSGSGELSNVFLQVALPALGAGATLEAATLNIHVTDVGGNGSSLMHVANSGSATGNASQQLEGSELVMDLSPASVMIGWLSIDVTNVIAADVSAGYSWAAFSLPSKSYSSFAFDSADSGFAPYLSVAAVPEPAGFALLSAGAVTMLARRRK